MTTRELAAKWFEAFSGAMRQPPDLGEFPDDCFDAGLVSDAGQSFRALYGDDAMNDAAALAAVLGDIRDPGALGNAVFSAWKGWERYEDMREHLEWYQLALERLAQLA